MCVYNILSDTYDVHLLVLAAISNVVVTLFITFTVPTR